MKFLNSLVPVFVSWVNFYKRKIALFQILPMISCKKKKNLWVIIVVLWSKGPQIFLIIFFKSLSSMIKHCVIPWKDAYSTKLHKI